MFRIIFEVFGRNCENFILENLVQSASQIIFRELLLEVKISQFFCDHNNPD